MGRNPNEGLAQLWQRRIAQQRQSGLSVAEFCRREVLATPSFYVWRKRLQAAAPSRARPRRAGAESAGRDRRRTAPLFVPVTLSSPASGLRMELPGGAVVTLAGDAPTELVTAVIRAALGTRTEE